MTFTETEPETNHQSNPGRTTTEPPIEPESNQWSNQSRTDIENALRHSDRKVGTYTAVGIGSACNVSDVAVGKAAKALKQAIPEEALKAENGRYTELAQVLMYQYFRRPETMTGAAWIHELAQVIGAMPSSVVDAPPDVPKHWQEAVSDAKQETSTLVLSSEAMLARAKALQDSDELGDDEAFEAEKVRRRGAGKPAHAASHYGSLSWKALLPLMLTCAAPSPPRPVDDPAKVHPSTNHRGIDMFRFRIVSANGTDTGSSYETAEKAVENCPPGRGVRDSQTGDRVDPIALRDKKEIRWF